MSRTPDESLPEAEFVIPGGDANFRLLDLEGFCGCRGTRNASRVAERVVESVLP
jgi:hypothetical protein